MRRAMLLLLLAIVSVPAMLAGKDKPSQFPGQKESGFLLPNGWTVTPAGEQVVLKDLPFNIIALSDNRHALVATSGYNAHELTLVDLQSKQPVQTETVRQSWFGVALSPADDKLW